MTGETSVSVLLLCGVAFGHSARGGSRLSIHCSTSR